MKQLPTYDEIVALHKKYAPSQAAFDLVFISLSDCLGDC